MTAQLVTDALVMAIWRRGKPDALLHHSDRGSQSGLKWSSQHSEVGGCDEVLESDDRHGLDEHHYLHQDGRLLRGDLNSSDSGWGSRRE